MNQQLRLLIPVIFTLLSSFTFSPPTQAASATACAIWMCLPTGFGKGCKAPHREFRKRTLRHQPAMPPWPSCEKKTDDDQTTHDHYTSKTGVAAVIPAHTICLRHGKNNCLSSRQIEEQIIKDRRCARRSKDGPYEPRGCTHTLRYTEVHKNGLLFGKTNYY